MEGMLGHGDREDRAVPRIISGIGAVVGVAGGRRHSLVTMREGHVLGFGHNGYGQLGLGAGVQKFLTPTAIDGIPVDGDDADENEGKE